jgi:hypothetical protein
MIIDLYHLLHDDNDCALIICDKTGIFYEAQCGGVGCTHPRAEGVFLPLFDVAKDMDECSFGCSEITYDPNLQAIFANAIDDKLKKLPRFSFRLRFDFARITELQEGWWPLVIKGILYDIPMNHKCYYHRGNCD